MVYPRDTTEFITNFSERVRVSAMKVHDGFYGVEICTSDGSDPDPEEYVCINLTVLEARAIAVGLYKSTCVAEEAMNE